MRSSFADGQNIFSAWRMYVQMGSSSFHLYFSIWSQTSLSFSLFNPVGFFFFKDLFELEAYFFVSDHCLTLVTSLLVDY